LGYCVTTTAIINIPVWFNTPWQACMKNNFGFPAHMTSLNITCIAYFIERLNILWRNLPFEVNLHENKTSEEMRRIAVNTARINHREYDCLVFCILTVVVVVVW
jgi:hypothetical protein